MSNVRRRDRVTHLHPGTGIEALERRDCPAVIGISGTQEISEAAASTALTVTLSEAQSRMVSVDYYLTGTATSGRDFRLLNGSTLLATPTGTITFRPGETSKTIQVSIVNDLDREGSESVGLTLFKARNATLGAERSASVTILDDDSYTASIVGRRRLAEGRIGTFELQLSSPATKTETFYVNTERGLATPGVDFRPLSQLPLIFSAGESVKRFRIQTLADGIANEYDEFFFLRVTPMSAGFPKVDPFGITIPGIGPAPLPAVSVSDVMVTEGDSGTTAATFTISLSAQYGVPVTVRYATANGTATAGTDYQPVAGTATFAPGETVTTVSVNVTGDAAFEPDETFSLVVSAPVNATLAKAAGVATVTNDDADPNNAFQIVVTFPDNSLTASQRLVFQQAAARWSRIINADLPDVTYRGRVIDDLEISATAPFIDGPYGTLGQAGPDEIRDTGTRLPFLGSMEFDSADVTMMERDGTFYNVILHEMGHVIGLGTLWGFNDLLVGEGTDDPRYVGANAVREYRILAGNPAAVDIPVENTGGQGTADGHWRESVFGPELMTGYAERPGVAMPISRMTVGALQDLGYSVNYAAADPYVIPAAARTQPAAATARAVATPRMRALLSCAGVDVVAAIMQADAEPTSEGSRQRAFGRLARG